jgi:hypothetical protein
MVWCVETIQHNTLAHRRRKIDLSCLPPYIQRGLHPPLEWFLDRTLVLLSLGISAVPYRSLKAQMSKAQDENLEIITLLFYRETTPPLCL